jgi:hypothetical protein
VVEKDQLRGARTDFNEFRNVCVLEALYFSAEVEAALDGVWRVFVELSVFAEERIAGESPREYRRPAECMDQLKALSRGLRDLMRAELQKGFSQE